MRTRLMKYLAKILRSGLSVEERKVIAMDLLGAVPSLDVDPGGQILVRTGMMYDPHSHKIVKCPSKSKRNGAVQLSSL